MGWWLADARQGQESAVIQRFDPRFWTVNFPRPTMASVRTTAADALRVDAVFYHRDELVGLIWESEDRWDHPLLAYATNRNYDRLRWRFRWRASGVVPLDAVHGPTLTIEGHDAGGNPRSWYVRLWNYATGTPTDALIDLNFGRLDGGFLLPGEADPVDPSRIERLFLSIVPTGFDPAAHMLLPAPQQAWVELTEISADGPGAMLDIGDILLPPHSLRMASAYDDSFNQTPERLLRGIEALGYRELINHYVGMSHYFRLEALGTEHYVSLSAPQAGEQSAALNQPCLLWHRDFAQRAHALGFAIIWSLSYELFNAHCWNDWKQRREDGAPALTGWVPPSSLLSPAHSGAMGYLHSVGAAFVGIARDAGMALHFQVGEPWWWITPDDHQICLYDDAARAHFGGDLVSIGDVRGPKTAAQQHLLDRAGALLAQSTANLVAAVRAAMAGQSVRSYLLAYLPTILDAASPDVRRANLPSGWAAPAFDVLQLEDYDWVIAGQHALTDAAVAVAEAQLGYPRAQQHYFSGFVLDPADQQIWPNMAEAINRAQQRGAAAIILWAYPQAMRDGWIWFDEQEADMQAFDDVSFPLSLSQATSASALFSTDIAQSLSGHEERNSNWADARMEYDVGPAIRSEGDLAILLAFFRARRGPAKAFRLRDPFDHSSHAMTGVPQPTDQYLGTGDGNQSAFALVKNYGEAALPDGPQQRRITRPDPASVVVAQGGVAVSGWTLQPGGIIAFAEPPPVGVRVTAGYIFDVPVRFLNDRIDVAAASFAAGTTESIPLVEVRE